MLQVFSKPSGVCHSRPQRVPGPRGMVALPGMGCQSRNSGIHAKNPLPMRHVVSVPCAATKDRSTLDVKAGVVEPGSVVLVAGASGGVGQLLTARLLESGYRVRALVRNVEKAKQLFGADTENLEIVTGDLRVAKEAHGLADGVDAVCSCIGTTAFPSSRWEGNNTTEMIDKVAVGNLIEAAPKNIKRFVLVTSAGVERQNQLPFVILNIFDVLKYKRMGELMLMDSGLPYTIIRPNRLTDGPYTSFDLNTLLRATRGNRCDVQVSGKDNLTGQASRIAVAEAILQSLRLPHTEGRAFAMTSVDGDGPQQDTEKWSKLFAAC